MNAPVTGAFERPDLTSRDYATLSALVHRETGILLPDSKRELVRSRLAKRLRTRGLNRFEDYLKIIGSDPRERAAALARMRDYLAARPETSRGAFTLPMVTDVVRTLRK